MKVENLIQLEKFASIWESSKTRTTTTMTLDCMETAAESPICISFQNNSKAKRRRVKVVSYDEVLYRVVGCVPIVSRDRDDCVPLLLSRAVESWCTFAGILFVDK